MTQHDMNIANASRSSVRSDINSALEALATLSSGVTAPSTTFAYQFWADTGSSPAVLKQRNAANNAWIILGLLGDANNWAAYANNAQVIKSDSSGRIGVGKDPDAAYKFDINGVLNSTGNKIVGKTLAIDQQFNCRLERASATGLILNRCNGAQLFIDGSSETIPSAGVSVTNSGLAADTQYYTYAYMSSGTMTLEIVTTVPATSSTYGHQIKTGDATRSLVGQVYTDSSAQFVDTTAARLVSSYYNRQQKFLSWLNPSGVTTASSPWVDLVAGSSGQVQFLSWGDIFDTILNAVTIASVGTANAYAYLGIKIDSTVQGAPATNYSRIATTSAETMIVSAVRATTTLGRHTANLVVGAGSGSPTYPSTYTNLSGTVSG